MRWKAAALLTTAFLACGEVSAMVPPPAAEAPRRAALPICQDRSWIIFFDQGSAQLSADALNWLASFSREGQERGLLRVDITGHTDGSAREAASSRLSQDRIDAVARALAALGIPVELMVGRAAEDREPLKLDAVGSAENRRVEIVGSFADGWSC